MPTKRIIASAEAVDPTPVPIHRSDGVDLGLGAASLPIAEGLAGRICSLLIFPNLTDKESALIVDTGIAFNPLTHAESA